MERRGKAKQAQYFDDRVVYKWTERLSKSDALNSLKTVWQTSDPRDQLQALKKIKIFDVSNEDLLVLTEMHALCSSRHPLQRTIASVLKRRADCLRDLVCECLHSTLDSVLRNKFMSCELSKIQYVEALLENFPDGEKVIQERIVFLLDYFRTVIVCKDDARTDWELFVMAIKTLMNTLHRALSVLHALLYPGTEASTVEIVWPQTLQSLSEMSRQKWIKTCISDISNALEILLKDSEILNEVCVNSSMLLVVLILTEYTGMQLKERVCLAIKSWLSCDSVSYFVQLAVCHGLVAKLPSNLLVDLEVEGSSTSVLLFLLPLISKLSESAMETRDRYIAARTLALWSSVTRQCVSTTTSKFELMNGLLPQGEITATLLKYIWSHWEDPVDGIRYQCKLIFENIIGIYRLLQREKCEDSFLSLFNSLAIPVPPTRGKFNFQSILVQEVSVSRVLACNPNLPDDLLKMMGHQALACHAGELWSRLTCKHWQENEYLLWHQVWVSSLVTAMCSMSSLSRQHTCQYCLQSLFQCSEECLQHVDDCLSGLVKVSIESKLVTRLACMRCAKSHYKTFELKKEHYFVLQDCMHHQDDQVRLSALGLLCESRRTTDPPNPTSLHMVLQFMHSNANTPSACFRYQMVNSIKKFLIRIKESSYTLVKNFHKGLIPDPSNNLESFKEFLNDLMMHQFEQLHPLSSFPTKETALCVLKLINSIMGQGTNEGSPLFVLSEELSSTQARALLLALQDSYSANKALALALLCEIPSEKLRIDNMPFLKEFISTYYALVTSPKAADTYSAAYFTRLFTHISSSDFSVLLEATLKNKGIQPVETLSATVSIVPLHTVQLLCSILEEHIGLARVNLIEASVSAPMYGTIESIRAVLENTVLRASPPNLKRTVFKKIVALCKTVAEVVSPVVCNSSPEGFLPTTPVAYPMSEMLSESGNAQSLLLCCWHCMKEISLLLGHIVMMASAEGASADLLDVEEFDVIGTLFIHQLTEARHRGAFEMAYNGFSKLCQCLWTSSIAELHHRPEQWVKELLESLQSTSLTKLLSITRRSAGLPFYLLAILTAEPASSGRVCFKRTMETLLSIARSSRQAKTPQSDVHCDVPEPAAVHALNILRALYRESRLGDQVVPFIPDGITIAIQGFAESFWPVRNSSTLLFSALITRIFGAKRVQDEHSMENKLTGKEFFARFPSLYKYLLDKLQHLVEEQEAAMPAKLLQPTLFPILILLSRLYPSSLDDATSTLSMKAFIPLLLRCTGCCVWKTRELVSCAVTCIVSPHSLPSFLSQATDSLSLRDQNKLHGLLLVINGVISTQQAQSVKIGDVTLPVWLLKKLLSQSVDLCWRANHCPVTKSLFLQIILKLLHINEGFLLKEKSPMQCAIIDLAADCVNQLFPLRKLPPLHLRSLHTDMFQFSFFVILHCDSHDSGLMTWNAFIQKSFGHHSKAVCLCLINCILQLRANSFVNWEDLKLKVCGHLEKEEDEEVLSKLYELMNLLLKRNASNVPQEVISKSLLRSTSSCMRMNLKCALLEFLSIAFCLCTELPVKGEEQWLKTLERESLPTVAQDIRVCVAEAVGKLWRVMETLPDAAKRYWSLVVLLLQDVDECVRNAIAKSLIFLLAGMFPQSKFISIGCPTPQSALKWALETMISHTDSLLAWDILQHLLSFVSDTVELPAVSRDTPNVLFDEDPVNNYIEGHVLLKVITTCMGILCKDLLLKQHVQELYTSASAVIERFTCQSPRSTNLPWKDPKLFMELYKNALLVKQLSRSVKDLSSLKEIHPLLTF